MFSFKSIVLIAAAFTIGAESSAVPAVAAAPLVAPTHLGYAHAVPQNIPPYAAQVNVFSKSLSPLVAAPYATPFGTQIAAPFAPVAGPFAAPYAAAPYGLPSPYAPYAAPFPYAPTAPLVRAPFGLAPAYVR